MAVLPDLDAMALSRVVMFEKTTPISDSQRAAGVRPSLRAGRRAGDALRAVEWSEITARLNAARDLRLLMRNESQAPIETVAASFGDAAASYFSLLEDCEPDVNSDGLGQSKVLGAMPDGSDTTRLTHAMDGQCEATQGDAREMQ